MPGLKGEIWDAADRVAAYLSVLLAVEYDIDAVDRVAKARKIDDFMEGVYNALRRRQNLEDTLQAKLREASEDEHKRALEDALAMVRSLNPSHVEKLRDLDKSSLKLVASYIGSRALAHTRTSGILAQIFQ
ncbi:MAG: hypothetical protein DRK00_05185 [Thermoprotei archaeon]|nr:MAG: hypothetical protein DRK00_05185 [Thermoprotei archaeon]